MEQILNVNIMAKNFKNNAHLVQLFVSFEFFDVCSDLFHHLGLAAFEDIVGSLFLVRCNEVLAVDGRAWPHLLQVGTQLVLYSNIQHTSSLTSISKVARINVPACGMKY